MRRITGSLCLVLALLATFTIIGVACSDDDDDDLLEDRTEQESEEDDSADNDGNGGAQDDGQGDTINTSPANGAEYLEAQALIASDLADEYGEECAEAVDLSDLSFSDVDLPGECRDYFDEFADRLDQVDPPDACADLHDLLLDALTGLAEGENDALDDLVQGEDGQPSEGIIGASVDCSGI